MTPSPRCRRALPVLFLLLLIPRTAPAQTVPDGFVYEAVVNPPVISSIGFSFLPDGRILIIEKAGGVRVGVMGSGTSSPIHTIPNVDSAGGEEGLVGLAVDPGWPGRPYLYFCYTHTDSVEYVTMYTVSGDLSNPASTSLSLGSPYHLLTDIPNDNDQHNAGTLRFGPDGMLYVSLGDDKNTCAGPQSKHILSGKILRLDVSAMPGAGSGPPPKADITPASGNPFPGPDENEKLVYAWGLRNPYRFSVDPLTNDLYVGDVGRSEFEELDKIDYAAGAGENFGWPELEALLPTGINCDSVNTWTDPIWTYPHDGVLPHSIIPGPIYRVDGSDPSPFPGHYDGSIFVLEFYNGWIQRIVEGPSGWELAAPVPGQPSAEHWADGMGEVSDLQQGPDGSLYMCHLFGEPRGIWRIRRTTVTDVAAVPAASARLRVSPNPVRSGAAATIRWDSAKAVRSLRIVDVTGRTVSSIDAGPGSAVWTGQDHARKALPAGLYFFRLETADGEVWRTKVSVLR
jgi:glucose/arabinose dehydrogenase